MDKKYIEKEISKKLYAKITKEISKKNLRYREIAEKIGTSNQNFSDQMKNLRNGKYITIRFLIKIQEFLDIDLIFFCV
ncbi:helix-turn-helix transcriptional regulator [Fusobacterium perfoetens]|uniref:helix-turn-helix domain-containing protein n=1 Tax=Fusobacterium perfoetens TaxID=852 RepID=UPI001F2160C6|nr:helix-turn-helix transcriptional regulator [Fusobacterium perfoetens]MCF2625277.1 helix-turn-helix transcriptional regulator [Fusobacterium perfoetens]